MATRDRRAVIGDKYSREHSVIAECDDRMERVGFWLAQLRMHMNMIEAGRMYETGPSEMISIVEVRRFLHHAFKES